MVKRGAGFQLLSRRCRGAGSLRLDPVLFWRNKAKRLLPQQVVKLKTPLAQDTDRVCRPVRKQGRRHRGLRPFGDDAWLLQTVNRAEFVIAGFRNRDIRSYLPHPATSAKKCRRQAAAVGRQLAMLRAHGLIRRVPGRLLYHVTPKGRRLITALLSARAANIEQLTQMAA